MTSSKAPKSHTTKPARTSPPHRDSLPPSGKPRAKKATAPEAREVRRSTPRGRRSVQTERKRAVASEPIIVYVGGSVDGTSFALDPVSQQRVREAFPEVLVSTRHIFIAHDPRETFDQSVGRFEDQIAVLLTGVSTDRLAQRFPFVSFRAPRSEREVGRLPAA